MLGLMTDSALSYTSPLYGRRTRDILLGPLRFCDARQFLLALLRMPSRPT